MSAQTPSLSQFVVFQLLENSYALPVEKVIEVLRMVAVTPLPGAPIWLSGVINLRGRIIPVVDLRLKFGLCATPDTVNSRIVVMDLELDGERTIVGGLADSVHEVVELEPGQINPPPRIAMRWRTELIQGMARRGDDFIIILNINQVFASDVTALLETTAPAPV